MEGKLVSSVPPKRFAEQVYDWDGIAELARNNPDMAVLAGEHVRMTTIKSVRAYTRSPFVTNEGRIKVSMRNSVEEADGHRYGDVYFEWVPAKKGKK
jgi:hypothetical protein